MKKYIIITLLAITQIFYLTADFNSSKSQLQQQVNTISNDLKTLDKLDSEYPSGYDAEVALNDQIGGLLMKTRFDLKSASNNIQQMKKWKLNPEQSKDFQQLNSQFNKFNEKFIRNYSTLFAP